MLGLLWVLLQSGWLVVLCASCAWPGGATALALEVGAAASAQTSAGARVQGARDRKGRQTKAGCVGRNGGTSRCCLPATRLLRIGVTVRPACRSILRVSASQASNAAALQRTLWVLAYWPVGASTWQLVRQTAAVQRRRQRLAAVSPAGGRLHLARLPGLCIAACYRPSRRPCAAGPRGPGHAAKHKYVQPRTCGPKSGRKSDQSVVAVCSTHTPGGVRRL